METRHVSILDLNPEACPTGSCNQLPNLVRHCIPGSGRLETTIDRSFESSSSSINLILVRPPSTEMAPDIVRVLRKKCSTANVIGLFCVGWDHSSEALHSLANDFDDFLSCPFNDVDVVLRVRRLLTGGHNLVTCLDARALKEKFHLESLVGESDCFLDVIRKVPPVACSDVTVVILGETGTGKELFARAIHYTSPRRDKPFVPINCGALPDQLFENEMFGHAKGAYTSASSVEKGLLAVAEGGTVFLDEVDSLSLSSQIKLLRFLQDREYRPLGSPRSVVANVRIVAATNSDLRKLVAQKQFREDLYHRLNIISLWIPPLRDRISDIPFLTLHLLKMYGNQQGRESLHLSAGALQKLASYSWPGNVRELEGVLQRALVLHPSSALQANDIDLPIPYSDNSDHLVNLNEAKSRMVGQFERGFLANLLTVHQGNISRAARAAGKERRSFQRLLQKHGLKSHAFRS